MIIICHSRNKHKTDVRPISVPSLTVMLYVAVTEVTSPYVCSSSGCPKETKFSSFPARGPPLPLCGRHLLSPAPKYSSLSSDSIPCALHKYQSYMYSNFHCANASEYPLHITIGWRIKGKRSIRLPPFVIRTGQIYWILHDRSGGTQNWYWLGKSGTPDVQILLINYHVAFCNFETFIIIQV